jgi:hypothetical protein
MSGLEFVHKVELHETFGSRNNRFALTALVAETLAVYYWCEAFSVGPRPYRFCVIGQRGLSDFVAQAIPKVLQHVDRTTDALKETEGFKFGSIIALREALRLRRSTEQRRPEYMDQCNVSTYRAKANLDKYYKVGVKDAKTEFDIEGFRRGQKQVWSLEKFPSPTTVLDNYARSKYGRSSIDGNG